MNESETLESMKPESPEDDVQEPQEPDPPDPEQPDPEDQGDMDKDGNRAGPVGPDGEPEPDENLDQQDESVNPHAFVISNQEDAGQHDTSGDSLVPPGASPHYPGAQPLAPQVEVGRLAGFLAEHFPEEVARSNRQVPESPVSTAIRLLTGLHAQVAMDDPTVRCQEQYCNKPRGHKDGHGWVHYSG